MTMSRRRQLAGLAVSALIAVCGALSVGAASTLASRMTSAATDADGDGLRDSFEQFQSHTDPLLPDSDNDGLSDAKEDPDHDSLTNLWEQRLRLNPLKRDSDADGKPDGQEDYDHDFLTNKFETTYRVTYARTNDSDGDGVRDSAEDPDGDRVSNRGEQRWKTDPGKRDTDKDGTPDGAEDTNGNGRSNAEEQDARSVPANLVPALDAARSDTPESDRDDCHIASDEHVYRHCFYGDASAAVQIALFGDSHAAHWFPAVYAVTQARGWRLDNYTRGACPSVDVKTFSNAQGRMDVDCADFRQHAEADMAAAVPTLVILTSRWDYTVYDENDQPLPHESEWDAGLARTLDALPASSLALVLEDTPLPLTVSPPSCLRKNPTSIAACERSRSEWINTAHADGERATAEANGAVFGSLNDQVCPYDPCGVVYDEMLAYRDNSHLTATFARSLAPSMGALIDEFLNP
jgi:hypothetical protein